MKWNNVKDKLPMCWSQHGSTLSSGYVLTRDGAGDYEINEYIKKGSNEYWLEGCDEFPVTHWVEIEGPNL